MIYGSVNTFIFNRRLDPNIWLSYQVSLGFYGPIFDILLILNVFALVVVAVGRLHRVQNLIRLVLDPFVDQKVGGVAARLIGLAVLVVVGIVESLETVIDSWAV